MSDEPKPFPDLFADLERSAQEAKDAFTAELRPVLEEADRIIAKFQALGIPVRIELPMGQGVKMVDLRIKSEINMRLK